jgi:hypothetical protein
MPLPSRKPQPDQPREGRTMTLVKQAAAVVGLVTAVAGLVFLFLPQLRPEESPPPPPPAEQSGRLTGLVLDPETTRGQYLARTDQGTLGFTKEQLARRGVYLRVRVELVGFRGRSVPIERELVDARTGNELGQRRSDAIVPTAERVTGSWPDWVALRPGGGSYVVVVKLLNLRGDAAIDCVQSEPFGGPAPTRKLELCA